MKRLIYLAATLMAAGSVPAQTPEERGLEIAMAADAKDQGFGDSSAELIMTLRNRHGEESVRHMRSKTLELADDGDKSLVIFEKPADVKGTALLTFAHKEGDDDQWLYLPALKRVKRISASNKSGPFVGSEFAYEDVSPQEVEKYSYRYLGDEMYEGRECHMVERTPNYGKSGYTRSVVWWDTAELRVYKIEFYDRKHEHQKTLTMHDYKQYQDRYWRAGEMKMVNHQTGKSTDLVWENYEFQTGLKDGDFTKSKLERAR